MTMRPSKSSLEYSIMTAESEIAPQGWTQTSDFNHIFAPDIPAKKNTQEMSIYDVVPTQVNSLEYPEPAEE